jgi:hypothetical protein
LDFAGDVDLFFSPAAPSAGDLGDFAGEDARLDLAGDGGFSATAGSASAPSACARGFFGDGAAFFALLAAARAFPISTSATVRFPPAPPPEADIPAAAAAAGAGTAPARFALTAGGLSAPDLAAAAAAGRRGEAADAEEDAAAKRRGRSEKGRREGGGARVIRVLGEGSGRHRRRSGEVVEVARRSNMGTGRVLAQASRGGRALGWRRAGGTRRRRANWSELRGPRDFAFSYTCLMEGRPT